ncbi:NAD+ synthetase [Mycoplasmopsis canis PG 14]|uniref:NH(3)-dependent NAD(+) synthetase n=1 Tax=Mycoplasmopsis canis TaxID=29555 RepID=A0A449ARK7_9BACT|nr:NAD(+) synthase [Mycoplasmopsis canis]AMD81172.1 NAD(+) synthetase [Mycoplasmopsis canis PG 14]EIE39762.1 NAD+ synthetase [Mycoplasmopsis canis PG 14]VEU68996.1 NAD+ synthetase [Mycoplasmopsis canis]
MSKISNYDQKEVFYDEIVARSYINKIQKFLVSRMKKANANGFIVGISGGIDSSLVYALAKSVAPKNTLGIVMPINGMTDSDLKHIEELENNFEDKFRTIDLSETFNSIKKNLQVQNKLAISNIKPRLRMTTLYALAQENNYLVLGTDNADEVFIGYFTKFGDGGADLLPISKLTKGEVKFIANLLNVPKSIINKKPSAGLWEGQTDEDELGFTYNDLDFYLNNIDNPSKLKKYLNSEVIEKIEFKHKITQHKRDKIYTVKNIK